MTGLTKKDFSTDQLVRWCPGCGDYAIIAAVQSVFAEIGLPKEQYAIVAGIGCSSRFPYYMNTFGFHTIHGRAPAFASGLKVTRPELSVWLVTGDGDGLSIGGNHLIHLWRRNIDINVMMFNNQIYGLTKGQYSPTSEQGKKTKSSPYGSLDMPFNPPSLALGAGASFVARTVDIFSKHLKQTLLSAHEHTGTSYVEIYQNCNIFNDGAFKSFTDRKVREERVLYMKHGEPLVWGKEKRFGLVQSGFDLAVKEITDDSEAMVHDCTSLALAQRLASMKAEDGFPVPVGIFYSVDRPTYDSQFQEQARQVTKTLGTGDIKALLESGDTWAV